MAKPSLGEPKPTKPREKAPKAGLAKVPAKRKVDASHKSVTRKPEDISFIFNWDTEPDPLYANLMMMAKFHPDTFTIVFGEGAIVDGRFKVKNHGRTMAVYVPISSSIRVPVSSMKEFVSHIVQVWNQHAEEVDPKHQLGVPRYGQITDPTRYG